MRWKIGWVYILKADLPIEANWCKIGHSKTPVLRQKQISSVVPPFETELYHWIKCADRIEAERRLHKHFAKQRLRGEWFSLTEKDLKWLYGIKFYPDQITCEQAFEDAAKEGWSIHRPG